MLDHSEYRGVILDGGETSSVSPTVFWALDLEELNQMYIYRITSRVENYNTWKEKTHSLRLTAD